MVFMQLPQIDRMALPALILVSLLLLGCAQDARPGASAAYEPPIADNPPENRIAPSETQESAYGSMDSPSAAANASAEEQNGIDDELYKNAKTCMSAPFVGPSEMTSWHTVEDETTVAGIRDVISACTYVISIYPSSDEMYINRGIAYRKARDYVTAEANFDMAIRLNPNNARAYVEKGWLKDVTGDKRGAITEYTNALAINGSLVEAYGNRATAKWAIGERIGALVDYDTAIEIDPNDTTSYANRGLLKHGLGQVKEGMADVDKAIEIDPSYAFGYYAKAFIYYKEGNMDKAQTYANISVSLEPDSPDFAALKNFLNPKWD